MEHINHINSYGNAPLHRQVWNKTHYKPELLNKLFSFIQIHQF